MSALGQSTLIRGVRILDGTRLSDADSVLLRDGHIVEIGAGLDNADAMVVDGIGRTLLPGLIDAHTHTPPARDAVESALRQALAFGVTTLICLSTSPETALAMKKLAAARTDVADLRSAGVAATVPGGHPTYMADDYPTLDSVDDVSKYLDDHIAAGMDQVKIIIEDGTIIHRRIPCMSAE